MSAALITTSGLIKIKPFWGWVSMAMMCHPLPDI